MIKIWAYVFPLFLAGPGDRGDRGGRGDRGDRGGRGDRGDHIS